MRDVHLFKKYFLLVFVFVKLNQIIDAKLKLNTGMVFILPGSGFMNYIKHETDEVIIDCSLTYPSEKENHTLKIFMDKEQDFSNAPVFGNRLSNLERNLCGIKVVDSKEEDSPNMTLSAHYIIKGETKILSYNSTFNVDHYTHVKMKDEVKEVEVGTKVLVTCGINNVQKSCTMFDPNGKIVTKGMKRCEYNIDYVTMDHIGKWTCVPTLTQSMKPLQEIMELRFVGTPRMETWYTEENGVGKIGCQYIFIIKPGKKMTFCEFVSPKNQKYRITMSSATERYMSIGTNFDEQICQIEFELPLLKEEIGTWKCIINKDVPTGGFVDVYPPNVRKVRSLSYSHKIEQTVQLGKTFTIECKVPYSTRNCYILSPDGEYFFGGGIDYFNLGECFTTLKAEKKHLGTWSCYFARDDVTDDDIIQVEVSEEYSLRTDSSIITTALGKSAIMMCTATVPIKSCQFVAPGEMTYNVFPLKKSQGIHYAGPGLEYGACGLEIESMKQEYAGNWICLINNMGDDTKTLNSTIRITIDSPKVETTHNASAIGVPVGIMVVAIVLLGIGLIRKFSKRSPNNSSRPSEGSNTDIPIFDITTTSYVQ